MRGLLGTITPSGWMVASTGAFLVLFVLLVIGVLQRRRRELYTYVSELPLHDEDDFQTKK